MDRSSRPSAPCSTNWRRLGADEHPTLVGEAHDAPQDRRIRGQRIERDRLEQPVAVRRGEERVARAEVDGVEGWEMGHAVRARSFTHR